MGWDHGVHLPGGDLSHFTHSGRIQVKLPAFALKPSLNLIKKSETCRVSPVQLVRCSRRRKSE
jgi:hypothetical protein